MDVTIDDLLDAQTILGVEVTVIDQLAELRRRANGGVLSLDSWRSEDHALRSELPAITSTDLDSLCKTVTAEAVGDEGTDAHWVLLRRLRALQPPPSDQELRDSLLATIAKLRKRTSIIEEDALLSHLERTYRLLPGLDKVTGLPWSAIAAHRVIDDPLLGPVPQPVVLARKRARQQATAEELEQAKCLAYDRSPADRKLWETLEEQGFGAMIRLPRLLLDAAGDDLKHADVVRTVHGLLRDPLTQAVLREQTASGWPPEYA